MNNLQKIVSDISGYTHVSEALGARNDYYYECETISEKLDFLVDFSKHADGVSLISLEEAARAVSWLDADWNGSDNAHHEFQALS